VILARILYQFYDEINAEKMLFFNFKWKQKYVAEYSDNRKQKKLSPESASRIKLPIILVNNNIHVIRYAFCA
jgi:hypothetical protein